MARSDPRRLEQPPSDPVRIYTLGRFKIRREGTFLPLGARGQRRPIGLLKVLIALGGQGVAESRLSDSLWPDADGDRAHHIFKTNLHRLRRLIGYETLELEDRRLSLSDRHCWVDAIAFPHLLDRGDRSLADPADATSWELLTRAIDLYQGPFLDGESDPAEVVSARERLHELFVWHVAEWGKRLEDHGQCERAAWLYRQGLVIDDLAERLCQSLMRCLLRQGQTADGIAVYQRFHRTIEHSKGVKPSPDTEQLYQALTELRR